MTQLYRYSIEAQRFGNHFNAFVCGVDEAEARAQFKALYPGAVIEKITSLGAWTCGECDDTGLVLGPFGESQVPCPACKVTP